MIWTLRIECIWGWYLEDECLRIVEIDSKTSLYDLHETIQDVVDFGRDHPFEFYAGRNRKNRKLLFDDSIDWEHSSNVYTFITLEKVYPLPKGLKLFYHFDFGDDWCFEITRSRRKPTEPQPGIKYPRVVHKIGPKPPQYGRHSDE